MLSVPRLTKLVKLAADHRRRRSPDTKPEPKPKPVLEFELVISPLSPKIPPAMISTERVLALPMLAELLRTPWDWITIFLAKMLSVLVLVAVPRFKLAPEIIETRFVVLVPRLAELLKLPADHRRRSSPDIRLEFKLKWAVGFELGLVISLLSPKMPPAMISTESVLALPMLAELLRAPWDWSTIFLAKMLGVLVAVSVLVLVFAVGFRLAPEIIETRFVVFVPRLAELLRLPEDCRAIFALCKLPA